jgi:hypothetical protein
LLKMHNNIVMSSSSRVDSLCAIRHRADRGIAKFTMLGPWIVRISRGVKLAVNRWLNVRSR